ncbi:MAG TPA: helix-turn-helix transcriptional regulator [Thermoanaerobaculia bacterium]|nr:helix-turn-helix transcriptional regulator [Thermoanaerobaculia bacterium]
MDDDGDPRDEKEDRGLVATVLRRSKHLSQEEVAKELRVDRRRVSEIERQAATPELIRELAKCLGFRTLHVLKTQHLLEFLDQEQRRTVDPLGPTPHQEVVLYEACRELAAEFERVWRDGIRSQNLERAREIAEGQWKQLEPLVPSERQAEVRRDAAFHTWGFCLYLCAESVRQATDDPKAATHVGRLAVVAARCCTDLPWAGRLVAYALAHFANTFRVLGKHHESEVSFAEATRLWISPGAAAADPGVLDPGRIFDLEASLRKDQRKLPKALELLNLACEVTHTRPRVLIKRALVLSLMGSFEEAIANLRNADVLLVDPTPRERAVINYNIGVNLCHLNQFDAAAVLAEAAIRIVEAAENRIDILRCRWLRARVLDGKGDRLTALSIYRTLLFEFDELDMTHDLALVTLELAALLLSLGQTRECRSLTIELPSYFEAKGIHQEALAALKVFSDSVRLETATETLARQVAAFLYLARGNQDLRFVPTQL